MRVLIADHDRDAIMTLGILLRSEGHEVWSTQQGTEVSGAVREFKPQLVLVDTALQGRLGHGLADELRRDHGAACPVVIGLAKPYDAEKLLSLVASFSS
jgi:DNA-binding response OmpR family regulator